MSNKHICLSCHQKHVSGHAFCEICLPWCGIDKNEDLQLPPELEEISLAEYLNSNDYLSLVSNPGVRNEVHWGDLISTIYRYVKDSEAYAEEFSKNTDDLLNHITHMTTSIDDQIKRIAKKESLALSYYSHFEDLDPTEIVGNSKVTICLQDYELEFEVFRTKLVQRYLPLCILLANKVITL